MPTFDYTLPVRGLYLGSPQVDSPFTSQLHNVIVQGNALTVRKGFQPVYRYPTDGTPAGGTPAGGTPTGAVTGLYPTPYGLFVCAEGALYIQTETEQRLVQSGFHGNYWHTAISGSQVFFTNGVDEAFTFDGKQVQPFVPALQDNAPVMQSFICENIQVYNRRLCVFFPHGLGIGAPNVTHFSHIDPMMYWDVRSFFTHTPYALLGISHQGTAYTLLIAKSGDIVLLQGDTPDTWQLVSTHKTARVISEPTPWGNDYVCLTASGIISLRALIFGDTSLQPYLDAINPALATEVTNESNCYVSPLLRLCFVYTPVRVYVCGLDSMAWSTFSLPIISMATWCDQVLFGAKEGTVYAHTGVTDLGNPIAFSVHMPTLRTEKNSVFSLIRFAYTGAPLSLQWKVVPSGIWNTLSRFTPVHVVFWDKVVWDAVAWAGDDFRISHNTLWAGLQYLGDSLQIRIEGSADQPFSLTSCTAKTR